MAKAEINLPEALKRVSFEVLRPYLHTRRLRARHRALYTSPEGTVRSGPGDTPWAWWANAYKDPDGRVFFVIEWVEDGRVIQETMFAYAIDIELGRADAFERFFPAAAATPADRQPHAEGGSEPAVRKLCGKEWVPEAYKRRPDKLLAMGITGASNALAEESETAPDCAKPLKARYIEKLLRDLGTFEKADRGLPPRQK